ncbi:MAG: alpha/beta hydrolase [Microthrixaceae bacterium]
MEIEYHRGIPQRVASALLALPDPIVQRIAGDPITVDGRTLNRSVQLLLAVAERAGRNALTLGSVEQRRAELRRTAALGMPRARHLHVVDRVIPGPEAELPVRIYRPFGLGATPPAIVFFHGGGWVVGDLDTHDGSCRALAVSSGCVVVSVDYRLAPEHRFPAAPHDCLAAYRWVVANAAEISVDPAAVAVAGDSAGGNLAAVVARLARDIDVPAPVAQGLIYPGTDFRMQSRSVELFAEGFFLTEESMHWFRDQYLPEDVSVEDPLVSPLLAEDLAGVAPAWVWTAGFDPLRDEGRAYAEKLEKAGVTTHYRCYDDQVHGFFGMGVLPGGLEVIEEMGANLGGLIRVSA